MLLQGGLWPGTVGLDVNRLSRVTLEPIVNGPGLRSGSQILNEPIAQNPTIRCFQTKSQAPF